MGLFNALSALSSATAKPDPNPYYGAQYVTPDDHPDIKQPMWLDTNGNQINDPSFTSLPPQQQQAVTAKPFHDPGFWAKLGSVGQEEQRANIQATQLYGEAARQARATRGAAQAIDPTLTNPLYAKLYDPRFNDVNRNTQAQAGAYGQTGAPSLVGSLGGQSDINTAKTMLAASTAGLARSPVIQATQDAEASVALGKAVNLDPLIVRHAINQVRTAIGQDPTEAQILDNINQVKLAQSEVAQKIQPLVGQTAEIDAGTNLTNAGIGSTLAQFNAAEQRLRQHTARLQDVGADYNAGLIAQRGGDTPFAASVGLNGVTSIPGVNPSYMNMYRLMNAKMGQDGTPITNVGGYTLPSKGTTTPAGSYTPGVERPTAPLIGNPNTSTPRAALINNPNLSPDEARDAHNEAADAQHDAEQTDLDAKIAARKVELAKLKAQQAAKKAAHLRPKTIENSGILGMAADRLKSRIASPSEMYHRMIGNLAPTNAPTPDGPLDPYIHDYIPTATKGLLFGTPEY